MLSSGFSCGTVHICKLAIIAYCQSCKLFLFQPVGRSASAHNCCHHLPEHTVLKFSLKKLVKSMLKVRNKCFGMSVIGCLKMAEMC